jgi:hypothetical protein
VSVAGTNRRGRVPNELVACREGGGTPLGVVGWASFASCFLPWDLVLAAKVPVINLHVRNGMRTGTKYGKDVEIVNKSAMRAWV